MTTAQISPDDSRRGGHTSPLDGSPAPSRDARRNHRSWPERVLGRHPVGILFGLPYAVFIAIIFAYPLVLSVYMSFHRYIFTAPGVGVPRPWVGLDNYRTALSDPLVRQAFLNILIFLVINVPLTVVLSLVLATALNSAIPLRSFFRGAYYVPYVTASVAVVGVWLFLFNTDGLVNRLLGSLAPNPSWLINVHWAMPSIALFVTWKQLGFFILLYLAALQAVPKELYESASVDGASKWRQFRSVTVPGVRHATTLVTLLAIVTGANLFTEPYLLTGGGGPDGKSASPVLVLYQQGIEQNHPDVAAAIGVLLVIGVLVIAGIQQLLERD
ncbi:sugar ABC transporter permease [Jatrophihabitans telluris]|uniref:Sugar ABC transporter permease n=1 Tax=Jatrophihabitans telluris TaxID=2038343 RepID=A0ABY4R1R3_9ACTN|nr:sugar ABC transporter permease [Jatrophihabitans telluris]UQX89070.1 sugar ABC transporter permease [Jatrophihabitans telluris]